MEFTVHMNHSIECYIIFTDQYFNLLYIKGKLGRAMQNPVYKRERKMDLTKLNLIIRVNQTCLVVYKEQVQMI